MRRIIVKHSHSRGIGRIVTEMFSPSPFEYYCDSKARLTRPHIELATVTRTGTRQPPSCGKKPKAVGQSVMPLPENSPLSPPYDKFHIGRWLIRATTDRSEGRTAVVVRDGNTVHMAKGCRLGRLLESNTLEITPCH
jgi:hypothetical protein